MDEVNGKKKKDYSDEFSARFDLFGSMAHYVAEKLHQRPGEILDNWSPAELIVAYGQYTNEEVARNYAEWKALPAKDRVKHAPPPEYAVRFYGDIE